MPKPAFPKKSVRTAAKASASVTEMTSSKERAPTLGNSVAKGSTKKQQNASNNFAAKWLGAKVRLTKDGNNPVYVGIITLVDPLLQLVQFEGLWTNPKDLTILCNACVGSGVSSKGEQCFACKGKGTQG